MPRSLLFHSDLTQATKAVSQESLSTLRSINPLALRSNSALNHAQHFHSFWLNHDSQGCSEIEERQELSSPSLSHRMLPLPVRHPSGGSTAPFAPQLVTNAVHRSLQLLQSRASCDRGNPEAAPLCLSSTAPTTRELAQN